MLRIALTNAAKFNTIEAATAYLNNRAVNNTPILLGEGVYLVPATNREAGMLIKAGYETAE